MRASSVTLLVAVAIIGSGCSQKETRVETNTAITSMSGTAISADGLKISFDALGFGNAPTTTKPTVVLVHGWSCNKAFWREQTGPLTAAGYPVVVLDLAGHGDSASGRETWQVASFGNDVQAVMEKLAVEKAIVVGHSMGGLVALQAAAQMPESVVGVIAIDSLHDAEMRYDPAQSDAMIQPFKADFKLSVAGMFTGMAGAAVAPELRDWIVENGTTSDPEAAIGLLYDYAKLDSPAMFKAARVPVRAINAAASPSQPPTMTERNQQYADFDATLVDGVGHFLQLESPELVNPILLDYLAALQ